MGFGKFLKRAFKPPKTIRKMKLGNVLKGVGVGLVTGGPVGAVLGAGAAAKGEADRIKDERAAAGQAQQIPIGTPTEQLQVIDSIVTPALPGAPVGSPTAFPAVLLLGTVAVILALLASRRR